MIHHQCQYGTSAIFDADVAKIIVPLGITPRSAISGIPDGGPGSIRLPVGFANRDCGPCDAPAMSLFRRVWLVGRFGWMAICEFVPSKPTPCRHWMAKMPNGDAAASYQPKKPENVMLKCNQRHCCPPTTGHIGVAGY